MGTDWREYLKWMGVETAGIYIQNGIIQVMIHHLQWPDSEGEIRKYLARKGIQLL